MNQTPENAEQRAALLKSYVARLSNGESLEDVRRDFVANFSDVDATEIANAEQALISEGAKISDVQRLCDVHSALFHDATREESVASPMANPSLSLEVDSEARALADIPGHPVHVFTLENEAISKQIEQARAALATPDALPELRKLAALTVHYAKKGDLLYPILKVNHDIPGPSEVMWGVDDEIRAQLRALLRATDQTDAWHDRVEKVLTRAEEMVYKETNILLPLCAQRFTEDEWLQMYLDMKGYDLCLIDDAGTWGDGEAYVRNREADVRAELSASVANGDGGRDGDGRGGDAEPDKIHLPSGELTKAQLDSLLNTLPIEITFIDADDVNRYWNETSEKKLLKRPLAALGRETRHCHPPMIEEMVNHVIESLKSGKRDSVDIWMNRDEPALVRYMAVRDRNGAYQGTVEVVQRMGFAKEHFEELGR